MPPPPPPPPITVNLKTVAEVALDGIVKEPEEVIVWLWKAGKRFRIRFPDPSSVTALTVVLLRPSVEEAPSPRFVREVGAL